MYHFYTDEMRSSRSYMCYSSYFADLSCFRISSSSLKHQICIFHASKRSYFVSSVQQVLLKTSYKPHCALHMYNTETEWSQPCWWDASNQLQARVFNSTMMACNPVCPDEWAHTLFGRIASHLDVMHLLWDCWRVVFFIVENRFVWTECSAGARRQALWCTETLVSSGLVVRHFTLQTSDTCLF